MQTPTPLAALRTQLAAMDVDGMIVPRADAYQVKTARRTIINWPG